MEKNNEIVLFETEDRAITLSVPVEQETVWLNRNQMAELFGRDVKTIGKHINNALKEELDNSTVAKFATVQNEGGRDVERDIEHYNLDMIISVGYRVKSKRGVEFRKWANSILKKYIIDGYAINEKRLQALEKTVDIQTRMIADALDIEEADVLRAVNEYTEALLLLDKYDHQALEKPDGAVPVYRITYEDCKEMVGKMRDSFDTDVFGVEKEAGKVAGIIAAVYQSVFGEEAYPSIEEKAANLLYFMIKDHPYADGCKRIAASLFLEFLNRNNALFADGTKRLSDGTLVAITLMIAESNPDEKEVMVKMVMNLLSLS
ncbi:MAG: virulence RhuM family protein [Lachnospiraceae bacterium]|nr:virulence RhuM family protein [Lachnospiraceae bacterium]